MLFRIRNEQKQELDKSGGIRNLVIANLRESNLKAEPDGQSKDILITDAEDHTARIGFDNKGNVSFFTTPLGRKHQFENNANGQRTSIIAPTRLRGDMVYDENELMKEMSVGRQRKYKLEYDDNKNLTKIIYPDSTSIQMEYSELDRLETFTDRIGRSEVYEHDDGVLITVTDGNRNITRFDYEDWDGPERATYADGSFETYEYYPSGLLNRITTNEKLWAEIDYDNKENIKEIRYGDGHWIAFTYNESGQILEARNRDITVKHEYDDKKHLIAEDQGGYIVRYKYDKINQLTGLTLPNGDSLDFSFDADGNIAQIKDWEDRSYDFHYDNGGRLSEYQLPNGINTQMRYTEVSLPSQITSRQGNRESGAPIFSQRYEYDINDRVTALEDNQYGRREYRYDAEGQILRASSSHGEDTYVYDASGNRIKANSETSEYNQLNQLISRSQVKYQYDACGNLISETGPNGTIRYSYNGQNLLTAVEKSDGSRIEFVYDAFARRILKKTENEVIRYIWAGDQLIGEMVESGGFGNRDYLLIPGSYTPIAMRFDGQTYYYHNDHLGVPQRLTDDSGRIVWSAKYSAYGTADVEIGIIKNHLRFSGQYYDEETGLHYNRYRYYSPVSGRYLSRDPMMYLGGLNFYIYADNNPINETDPQGMWSWSGIGKALLAGAAAVAVGALVVAAAPVALAAIGVTGALAAGATVVAVGAAAGAAGAGVTAALNGASLLCVLSAMGKGALGGAIAALPFAFLPATAGVLAFAGMGAVSGGLGYVTDHLLTPGSKWSWKGFFTSIGVGAATAGLSKYIGGKISKWSQKRAAANHRQRLRESVKLLKEGKFSKTERREIIEAFGHDIKVVKLKDNLKVYRYYGDKSNPRGKWLSPKMLDDPVNQLALPSGNKASNIKVWEIPKGTEVIRGTVAPNFDRAGGAKQIFLPDPSVLR